jgi:predicted N-formylglutamate amidohydrolase
MTDPLALVLSCEHGGNRIPAPWRALFRGQKTRLNSHRGYDIGSLACARALARRLDTRLLHADTSRLLIDLNRSPHHPALYSDVTRGLPPEQRRQIFTRHYLPHRKRVEARIEGLIAAGRRVLHVAVHSFTPALDGVARRADIALLYDPARRVEARLCRVWQRSLERDSELIVRRNYPYRGVNDGLTRYLRTRFGPAVYAGVELELNQRLLTRPATARVLYPLLAASLQETMRLLQGSGPKGA